MTDSMQDIIERLSFVNDVDIQAVLAELNKCESKLSFVEESVLTHKVINKTLREALGGILKWQFTTDGRKFDGDYKEVVKEIMKIAREALTPE